MPENITFKEYLVAQIAQGLAANPNYNRGLNDCLAVMAISFANTIINQLSKESVSSS